MTGRILSINANKYNTLSNNQLYELSIRGSIKYNGDTIRVGDIVEFDNGVIYKINKRSNEFIRPRISNVDYVILTTTLKKPDFSSELLDKFLVFLLREEVTPIIVFTKSDLMSEEELNKFNKIKDYYSNYYMCFMSNKNGVIEKEKFLNVLKNKVSVISGQTGSGKSHLLNNIDNSLMLKTQEISESLNRGKHTTRNVTIYHINDMFIADSPGFSALEITDIDETDLKEYFPEFVERLNMCKYNQCTHTHEPMCKVKDDVLNGTILNSRYESYTKLLNEIKELKRKR